MISLILIISRKSISPATSSTEISWMGFRCSIPHSPFIYPRASFFEVLTTPSHRENLGLASIFLQHLRIFFSTLRDPRLEIFPKRRPARHRASVRRISSRAAESKCGLAYRPCIQTRCRDSSSGTSAFCDQTLAFFEFLLPAVTIRRWDKRQDTSFHPQRN